MDGILNCKSKDFLFYLCVMSDLFFVYVDIDVVFCNLIFVKNF